MLAAGIIILAATQAATLPPKVNFPNPKAQTVADAIQVLKETADAKIVAEARAFMADYGRDLQTGNRAGIARRYDRRGAYMVGQGHKMLATFDFLKTGYMTKWRQPKAFAFEDLSFEPAGPDAVVVVGKFQWTNPDAPPKSFTYTGLLVRQDGGLKIRVEDEDPAPAK